MAYKVLCMFLTHISCLRFNEQFWQFDQRFHFFFSLSVSSNTHLFLVCSTGSRVILSFLRRIGKKHKTVLMKYLKPKQYCTTRTMSFHAVTRTLTILPQHSFKIHFNCSTASLYCVLVNHLPSTSTSDPAQHWQKKQHNKGTCSIKSYITCIVSGCPHQRMVKVCPSFGKHT